MQAKDKILDLVIIGGGPAALTAAIYALKGNINVTFVEKDTPGGKMSKTQLIDNYPGFEKIDGPDLAIKMLDHARLNGAKFVYGNVVKLKNINDKHQQIVLKDKTIINAKYVIIATGMMENVPDLNNIEKLKYHGVSYCAICDGSLFKEKKVAVIGGGNSAVEESIYLSSVASEVHLFVRRNVFRADKSAVDKIKKIKKIKIHMNSQITKLIGEEHLTGVEANINGKKVIFDNIEGLFPYIGTSPQVFFASHLNIFDKTGFINVNENMETNVSGIFAAGDVVKKTIRQISTAINDGTIAAKTIVNRNAS